MYFPFLGDRERERESLCTFERPLYEDNIKTSLKEIVFEVVEGFQLFQGQSQVEGCCERSNEPSDNINFILVVYLTTLLVAKKM